MLPMNQPLDERVRVIGRACGRDVSLFDNGFLLIRTIREALDGD